MLYNEDTESINVQKFHYLPSDVKDHDMFDIKIRKRRVTVKKKKSYGNKENIKRSVNSNKQGKVS